MFDLRERVRFDSLAGISDALEFKELRSACRSSWQLSKRTRWMLLVLGFAAAAVIYEMRTSALQSWILSHYAQKMSFRLGSGPSPSIIFPKHGPFDVRAGYALIPEFESRLRGAGYRITDQARFSPALEQAARWGVLPPYAELVSTSLTIRGMDGVPLFQAPVGGQYFRSFEEVPELAVKSLLMIENRELEDPVDDRTNPVVDWNRLAKAAIMYAGHKLGLPLPVEGGSTLATQMEKYRHSYEGRTDSILAKLRQMTDASLKVYQKGPDTRAERRQIILDYLNSIPLAASPGYGEIHGVGNGLDIWFSMDLDEVHKSLSLPDGSMEKAKAFKHILALLCSVKAPSHYLVQNRTALLARVNFYAQLLGKVQIIEPDFARQVESLPLSFSARPAAKPRPGFAEHKAANEIRSILVRLLGVPGFYELDRLHLNVASTIDATLQSKVVSLFNKLRDPQFVDSAGLREQRLLEKGDPGKVIYGMMLFEKTPKGNYLRVLTDNLNAPFDINTGMKMQLGSTAKLRTLVSYLDVVAALHQQFSLLDSIGLEQATASARDPITRWAVETLAAEKKIDIERFLQLALDRKYSANPGEAFFTGGGAHYFENFEKKDNGRILTVREATAHSVNLVYIRLMRDLVRYYEARLPYDTAAILSDPNNPTRLELLQEIADAESRLLLYQTYRELKNRSSREIVAEMLGRNLKSERQLSILFYAWHNNPDKQALAEWLSTYLGKVTPEQTEHMAKAYGSSRLNLSDFGYLLGIHPLRLWCAGELARDPSLGWEQIWNQSSEPQRLAAGWLFKTRNRSAQDLRLRIRFEQDAFVRLTPFWQRLGFPFDRLVPSLATAIGSSGDRPEALAQLMGILLNDGVMKPTIRIAELRFAGNTPYETAMRPAESDGTRVIPQAVARAVLPVLAQVVQSGTAVRLAGAFRIGDQLPAIGGKTGSGDNRFDSFGRRGQVISSRPVDRTAVFVFYIGDRFFGVMTAYVPGMESGDYGFTSSLPVAILKLLSKDIESLWVRSLSLSSKDPLLVSDGSMSGR
jgi:membrane peptidoglycan carboxypeptidase